MCGGMDDFDRNFNRDRRMIKIAAIVAFSIIVVVYIIAMVLG